MAAANVAPGEAASPVAEVIGRVQRLDKGR
jgi:hypothetical protein